MNSFCKGYILGENSVVLDDYVFILSRDLVSNNAYIKIQNRRQTK